MKEYIKYSHSVSQMNAHIIWVTKYRYHVLKGDIQIRCRDLLVQVYNSENLVILKGVVAKIMCICN
jgi:putative transposase